MPACAKGFKPVVPLLGAAESRLGNLARNPIACQTCVRLFAPRAPRSMCRGSRPNQRYALMLIRRPNDVRSSEITDRALYLRRRDFLGGAAAFSISAALPLGAAAASLAT